MGPLLKQGLANLTAGDLMTVDLVRIAEDTPLRRAAQIFHEKQISGAPVVDSTGRCIGVLSAADFVRIAAEQDGSGSTPSATPVTCAFQKNCKDHDNKEYTLCTLPLGTCAIQGRELGPDGVERILCKQPGSVFVAWQIVDLAKVPMNAARNYMIADPVTVTADIPVRELARKMIDAHIHRVIVVNSSSQPIGIVTSTDIIAAVAYAVGE